MDEKDWIIARLMYALYAQGRNADYDDARKTTQWFIERHGHDVLLKAYSMIMMDNKIYEPFWKGKGTWE